MALYDQQRSAFRTVAPNVQDRNRGQGLPSTVSDDGYRRLEATLQRRQASRRPGPAEERTAQLDGCLTAPVGPERFRRFAAVSEVEKAGFKRVAAGFYQEMSLSPSPAHARTAADKLAHPIWELRAAEDDGGGYVLIRRREERAVDLRQAGAGGGAGAGTAAAVGAGIVRYARRAVDAAAWDRTDAYPINPARDQRRRAAPQSFLVSLLQVPGGDVSARKTIFSNEPMDLEALERLVGELKPGSMTVTHDTWTDGEWELRVRGPKGQLIHPYESVGPDEIGGAKGQALMDSLEAVIGGGAMGEGEGGMPPAGEEPLPLETPPEAAPMEGAPPAPPAPPAGGEAAPVPMPPEAGVLAPSAAALTKGARVLVVKQGQIADAVVLMVNPQQQAVEVMFGGGGTGSVPMGDILDPSIDMDDAGDGESGGMLDVELELDDGGGGDGGGEGEDGLVEITADDLPAGSGGAGQDPFDVEVSPASEEEPVTFAGGETDSSAAGSGEEDLTFDGSPFWDREAARYLTARMHVNAVEFMGGFRPGAQLEVLRPFTTFYQQVPLEPGAELTVEGFHQPTQDQFLGFQGLPDPVPGGDPFENLRIRLVDNQGQIVLITPEELQQQLDFARGGDPSRDPSRSRHHEPAFDEDTRRFEEDMPSAPMGPRIDEGDDVDPYGDTVVTRPQFRPTIPARPQHGGY